MNFLEALEANKTKRVKCSIPGCEKYEVGEMREKAEGFNLRAMEARWEEYRELEVIGFLAEFSTFRREYDGAWIVAPVTNPENEEYIKQLVGGRKWRVRCEEI